MWRYESEGGMPEDWGRVGMAVSMHGRFMVTREHGAMFYEDVGEVEELRERK